MDEQAIANRVAARFGGRYKELPDERAVKAILDQGEKVVSDIYKAQEALGQARRKATAQLKQLRGLLEDEQNPERRKGWNDILDDEAEEEYERWEAIQNAIRELDGMLGTVNPRHW
jgi:hypothetical protein